MNYENKTTKKLEQRKEKMWEQVKSTESSLNQFCKWIGVKNIEVKLK